MHRIVCVRDFLISAYGWIALAVAQKLNKHRDGIVREAVESTDEDGVIYNEKELLEQMKQEHKTHEA